DHAGAMALIAPRLEDGVERHNEEPAAHRDRKEVSDQPPVLAVGEEGPEIDQTLAAAGDAAAGAIEVEGEERHAERAERRQPRGHFAAQQPAAQDGADADPDGE